jgi:hypothetical protein
VGLFFDVSDAGLLIKETVTAAVYDSLLSRTM